MVAARSITRSQTKTQNDRIRRLEVSTPLGSSSVTKGRVRIASDEGLLVQGSARTTGTQSVDGLLEGTGTLDWTGPLNNSGPFINTGPFTNTGPFGNTGTFTNTGPLNNSGKLTQTGDADLNGNTRIQGNATISGSTDITGVTTLKNNLNVTSGGKIQSGVVVIDGTDGGRVAAPGATLSLVGTQVTFTGATTAKNGMLSQGDIVAEQDVIVSGGLYLDSLPTISIPGAPAGLLAIDGGRGKRTI